MLICVNLEKCYKNREEFRNGQNCCQMIIPENKIVWIKRIKADITDKNSADLLQIKLADDSTIVVEDNRENRNSIFN